MRELKAEGRLPRRVRVRSSKYLNSRIELGIKRFDHAAVTISGIELVQKIQKHQFKTGKLGGRSATIRTLHQSRS